MLSGLRKQRPKRNSGMNRNTNIKCHEYKLFVRSKPCCACGKSPTDFAHNKARGMGNGKQNDLTGIPLCRSCHSESHQIGDEKFQHKYSVNLWQESTYLLIEFFIDEDRRFGSVITESNVLKGPWDAV